jgi:hypothetical protein
MQRRMGRKKWTKILTQLQADVRRGKSVERLSETEYQSRIKELASSLRSVLNVIDHRGKNYPPRWPREA